MQSIYTAGSSSYSVANLYTPAGVVNITSSYLPQNSSSFVTDNNGNTQHWNGEILTAPTSVQTSVIVDYVHPFPNSVQQIFETEKFVGYIPIPPRPPTFLSANVVSYTNILQRASFLSINLLEETDIPLQPSTNVLGVPTIVVDFVTVNDETYTVYLTDLNGNEVFDINDGKIEPIISKTSPVTFVDIVDNRIYNVKIIATNKDGNSPPSLSQKIIVETTIPPSPIINVTTTENSIIVTFTNVDNLFMYNLTLSNLTEKEQQIQTKTSPVVFTETDIKTIYSLSVTSSNSVGTSTPTKISNIILNTPIPSAPKKEYIFVDVDNKKYIYKFNDPNVLVYQLTISNSIIERLVLDPSTNFFTCELPSNKNLELKLVAMNNAGSSPPTILQI